MDGGGGGEAEQFGFLINLLGPRYSDIIVW